MTVKFVMLNSISFSVKDFTIYYLGLYVVFKNYVDNLKILVMFTFCLLESLGIFSFK